MLRKLNFLISLYQYLINRRRQDHNTRVLGQKIKLKNTLSHPEDSNIILSNEWPTQINFISENKKKKLK